MTNKDVTERIRSLNDALRCQKIGGQIMATRGVTALGPEAVSSIVDAIGLIDEFTENNDPHHEHDFGSLTYRDHRIFWKIDYYDTSFRYASPDSADPDVTTRVLTVMLAEEY